MALTEEHKAKIRAAARTPEAREAARERNKRTAASRDMSAVAKSQWTPERRAAQAERARKLKMSKEQRAAHARRMSSNNPMHDPEVAAKVGKSRRGWKPPEATLKRMSETRARRLQATSGTDIELAVMEVLMERLGANGFETQYRFADDPYFVWDFAIPARRILIEVDGCYWHGCEACGFPGMGDVPAQDARKDARAAERGWKLIRIRGCDVRSGAEVLRGV